MPFSSELRARAEARVGTTLLGKYRLDAVLGIGGMSTVYAATHRNAKRVAVKILHPELAMSTTVRSHFQSEGYAANSVGHPGVVRIDDDDITEDGSALLVMELLDGIIVEALRRRFRDRLPPSAALNIGLQLLEVLEASHANGIVHRDLKPANLFMLRDGALKVLDFGIARVRDLAASGGYPDTETGALLGTPGFMAPEQALGRLEEIDARTDLWAVSATLFTLLTGESVHGARSLGELRICAGRGEVRPLRIVAPEIPCRIADAIGKGLSADRAGRWTDAVAMGEALRSACVEAFGCLPAPFVEGHWEPPSPVTSSGTGPATAPRTETSRPEPSVNAASRAVVSSSHGPRRAARFPLAVVVLVGVLLLATVAAFLTTGDSRRRVSAIPPDSRGVPSGRGTAEHTIQGSLAPVEPVVTDPTERPARDLAPPSAARAGNGTGPSKLPPSPDLPKPSCAPPYTIDADGIKHPKASCL
jgi:serine/threonine protein kinase